MKRWNERNDSTETQRLEKKRCRNSDRPCSIIWRRRASSAKLQWRRASLNFILTSSKSLSLISIESCSMTGDSTFQLHYRQCSSAHRYSAITQQRFRRPPTWVKRFQSRRHRHHRLEFRVSSLLMHMTGEWFWLAMTMGVSGYGRTAWTIKAIKQLRMETSSPPSKHLKTNRQEVHEFLDFKLLGIKVHKRSSSEASQSSSDCGMQNESWEFRIFLPDPTSQFRTWAVHLTRYSLLALETAAFRFLIVERSPTKVE